jgi:hypothetical protein
MATLHLHGKCLLKITITNKKRIVAVRQKKKGPRCNSRPLTLSNGQGSIEKVVSAIPTLLVTVKV